MKTKLRIYTVDLDSTLFDTSHRSHLISTASDPEVRNRETDWDAHALACVDDTPVEAVVALVKALRHTPNSQVHFVSGRSRAALTETLHALNQAVPTVSPWMLHMAPAWREDPEFWNRVSQSEYKIQRIQDVVDYVANIYPAYDVSHVLHVDDHAQIVADLNDAGIHTLAVRTPYEIPPPSHLSGVCAEHGGYLYFCGPCSEKWAEENPESVKKVQAMARRCLPKSLGGSQPDLEEA